MTGGTEVYNGWVVMSTKRLALPIRRSMNLTEPAYDRLRALNERYGLGNNYLMSVLLERLDDFANAERLDAAFQDFISEYGAPAKRKEET